MSAARADDLRGASLRLTAQFTALVLVLVAVVGAIVFGLVSTSVAEADQRTLAALTQLDSPDDSPSGSYLTMIDGRTGDALISSRDIPPGLVDTSAIAAVAAGGADVSTRRSVDGQDYLQLTTASTGDRNHDRVVQVSLDLRESGEELGRLAAALIVGGLLAVVLAFGAAYLMARRAIRPLADALALQRRFVADASHELRTPLTLLSTRAQMLRRRGGPALPEDVSRSVDEIVTDTRALTEILEDLLIAADPRDVADPEPVDLAATADEAVRLLRDDAAARGLRLTRAGSAEPVLAFGSRAALLRLVIALATNALDHARSEVTVTVDGRTAGVAGVSGSAAFATGGTARIRVTDDGPGFPPEIEATAFERFASARGGADPAVTRHYGLGLAIVAEIVRRYHGTVEIEHPETGAAVTATFPPSKPLPRR